MNSKILSLLACMMLSTLPSCTGTRTLPTSDPDATPQTAALLSNLRTLAARGTMIGHQDALAYGVGWYDEPDRCDFHDAFLRKPLYKSFPAVVQRAVLSELRDPDRVGCLSAS